ncbi:MAG TPA: efflux RND transporter periplasmic adaptor subunit [Planctomycetota bacterium]|nr:efflux RND transporter periplasmic adaptor subunit [Planctomycetota bacterium]
MKLFLILLVAFLVLAGLATGGVIALQHLAKPKPVFYKTAKIDVGEIPIVATATGNVEPTCCVKVGSQVSGRVREVKVKQDDPVKEGQIIAVLDTELMENDLRDKELTLRQSKSNLLLLEIEATTLDLKEERTKQSLDRLKVETERVKASADLAGKTFKRYEEMVANNASPISDLDIKRLEKENAERDVTLKAIEGETLKADLKEIVIGRRNLTARVEQTKLAVEQADQAVQKAKTNLSYANILAPIDGVVMECLIDKGQTIAAQFQTPDLFKIAADLSCVQITANIDEIDVGKIKPGQRVSFEVDAFRGEKFTGTVRILHFKSETKANLVSYPVVIEAHNPAAPDFPFGKLRPGMTAYLEFDVAKKTEVRRVPAAALRFSPPAVALFPPPPAVPAETDPAKSKEKGTPATIYIKDSLGQPTPLQIRVGESNGQFYELLSETPKPGDEVITGTLDTPVNSVTVEVKE